MAQYPTVASLLGWAAPERSTGRSPMLHVLEQRAQKQRWRRQQLETTCYLYLYLYYCQWAVQSCDEHRTKRELWRKHDSCSAWCSTAASALGRDMFFGVLWEQHRQTSHNRCKLVCCIISNWTILNTSLKTVAVLKAKVLPSPMPTSSQPAVKETISSYLPCTVFWWVFHGVLLISALPVVPFKHFPPFPDISLSFTSVVAAVATGTGGGGGGGGGVFCAGFCACFRLSRDFRAPGGCETCEQWDQCVTHMWHMCDTCENRKLYKFMQYLSKHSKTRYLKVLMGRTNSTRRSNGGMEI